MSKEKRLIVDGGTRDNTERRPDPFSRSNNDIMENGPERAATSDECASEAESALWEEWAYEGGVYQVEG